MPFGISGFGAQQTYPAPQVFQALSLGGAPPVPPAPPYGTPNENLVPVARTGNPAFPANLTIVAHVTYQAILKVTTQVSPSAVASKTVTPPPNPAAKEIQSPGTNTSVLTQARPQLPLVANTTSAVEAPNPALAGQIQGPAPGGIPARADLAEGLISFQVLVAPSSVSSGVDALNQTIAQLQPALKAVQQAPANPNAATASSTNGSSTANAGSTGGATTGGSSGTPASSGPPASAAGSQVSTPAPASPTLVGRIVQTVQSLAIGAIYSSPVFSFSA